MSFRMLSIVTVAGMLAVGMMPARAQFAVIDPANLVQNVLIATRELQQIQNEVQSLQNEAQMLINESRNLQTLSLSRLGQLQATIATTQRLLNQTQGLTFQLAAVQQQFAQFYPAAYSVATSRDQLNADAMARWLNSRQAVSTALQLQSQASQNVQTDQSVLADLVNSSQSAVGALQAAQATNQLIALQVRESIQSQQLAMAQDRATTLEHARTLEVDARSRELRQRFMTQSTTYTPQPLQGF